MPNDDKRAAIEAKYRPVINKLLAQKTNVSRFAAGLMGMLMLRELHPGRESETAEITIEKVTTQPPAPIPNAAAPIISRGVTIGRDVEGATDVAISDLNRCGGLYVLGQPRTGKSTMLVKLALADIEHGQRHSLY